MDTPQQLDEVIDQALASGEGEEVEFKERMPERAGDLAKEIAAFATKGKGLILLGVDDDGNVVGFQEKRERVEGIVKEVSPPPVVTIRTHRRSDHRICSIKVHKGDEPVYYYQDRPYIRQGSISRPATYAEVEKLIREKISVSDSRLDAADDVASPKHEEIDQGSKEFAQREFHGKAIRIVDLVTPDSELLDRVFVDCELDGPAVLVFLESVTMQNAAWDGSPDTTFWEIPLDSPGVIGAVAVRRCKFVRCRFTRIGIAAKPDLLRQIRSGFGVNEVSQDDLAAKSRMEYEPGEIVRLEQNGTLKIGGIELTDSSFDGVKVVAKNADGSYQVDLSFVANAPGMNSVTIPAEWIRPLQAS